MSEPFKATHVSKGGVQVKLTRFPNGQAFYVKIPGGCPSGIVLNEAELTALFDPILEPVTVAMPLELARALYLC